MAAQQSLTLTPLDHLFWNITQWNREQESANNDLGTGNSLGADNTIGDTSHDDMNESDDDINSDDSEDDWNTSDEEFLVHDSENDEDDDYQLYSSPASSTSDDFSDGDISETCSDDSSPVPRDADFVGWSGGDSDSEEEDEQEKPFWSDY